jgi:hypothetical protein
MRVENYKNMKDKIQNRRGLREIVLKRNKLGAEFMEALSVTLRHDRFIKVIDVSQNLINEQSFKYLVNHSLQENTTLTTFEVQGNPGLSDKLRKQIALCLLKNIDCQRTLGIDLKPHWIRKESLMFKIPKRILNEIGLFPTAAASKVKKMRPPSIIDCKTMGDEGGDGPQVMY